jgi:hypothetical protein
VVNLIRTQERLKAYYSRRTARQPDLSKRVLRVVDGLTRSWEQYVGRLRQAPRVALMEAQARTRAWSECSLEEGQDFSAEVQEDLVQDAFAQFFDQVREQFRLGLQPFCAEVMKAATPRALAGSTYEQLACKLDQPGPRSLWCLYQRLRLLEQQFQQHLEAYERRCSTIADLLEAACRRIPCLSYSQ